MKRSKRRARLAEDHCEDLLELWKLYRKYMKTKDFKDYERFVQMSELISLKMGENGPKRRLSLP